MRKCCLKHIFMTHTFWIFKTILLIIKQHILRGLILLVYVDLMVCEFYCIPLGKFYQRSRVKCTKWFISNWQNEPSVELIYNYWFPWILPLWMRIVHVAYCWYTWSSRESTTWLLTITQYPRLWNFSEHLVTGRTSFVVELQRPTQWVSQLALASMQKLGLGPNQPWRHQLFKRFCFHLTNIWKQCQFSNVVGWG